MHPNDLDPILEADCSTCGVSLVWDYVNNEWFAPEETGCRDGFEHAAVPTGTITGYWVDQLRTCLGAEL